MATARSNFAPVGTKLMYHCAGFPKNCLDSKSSQRRPSGSACISMESNGQESDSKRDRVRAAIQTFKDDEEKLLRQRNETARLRAHNVERSVSMLIGGFSA